MTDLVIKLFVKNREQTEDQKVRSSYVTLASTMGIALNILLFIGKLVFGILSGSVAIIADAFNNISDAGSSVVSLVGFKLSLKHVDKKHPFGHGRMEYITGFIVDMLIILVGFELLTTSIEKIFSPTLPTYNTFTMVVLGISVVVKLWLFFFYRKIGKKINSEAIKSTSVDSITDCAATTLVFVSLIISKQFNIVIDGYVGILVAGMIILAGVRAAKGTIDLLLGAPPTKEYIDEICEYVKNYPEIVGVHDIMVHDYGVGRKFISFHAEMPSDFEINLAHEIVDTLERDMFEHFGAIVTVHFDPIEINDAEVSAMRAFTEECVKEVNNKFTIHDFRMTRGEKNINLIFDLVIPIDYIGDDDEATESVSRLIREKNDHCFTVIKAEHPFY